MHGDRGELRVGDARDVDERIGPQRMAHFIERDASDGEISEERPVARDDVAKRSRQREMIGMNLDRARRRNQVRPEVDQDVAERGGKAASVGKVSIRKVQEFDVSGTQRCDGRPRLPLPLARFPRLPSVRRHHHPHFPPFAQMERHQPAATDDLVVGMRRQHQQSLAA